MKKFYFNLLLILLLLQNYGYSKKNIICFNKIFISTGNEQLSSIQPLKNEEYIAAGYKATKNKSDIWVIKFDKYGDKIWEQIYKGKTWNKANVIKPTKDNGYILIGESITKNSIGRMARVLKLDEKGNIAWQKYFNFGDDNEVNDIIEYTNGNYILTGSLYFQKKKKAYLWVLKLNQKGNILMNKTYGGNNWDSGCSIQKTYDNGYIIAGVTETKKTGLKDIWIVKINKKGKKIWERIYGNRHYDSANSIIQTSDTNYIVAGYTYSYTTGKSSAWILKLDRKGRNVWHKIYGGKNWDDAHAILEASDGGYIFAGYTKSKGIGGKDAWLVKINKKGEILWEKTYGNSCDDEALSLKHSKDGGYIIAGYSISEEAEVQDAWILKTDKNGNSTGIPQKLKKQTKRTITPYIKPEDNITFSLIWDKTYGTGKNEKILSMTYTKDNNMIAAGYSESLDKKCQAVITKINNQGKVQWWKTFSRKKDARINSVYPTPDKGCIAAGYIYSKNNTASDIWVIRLNKKGKIIWHNTFGGKNHDKANTVAATKDGGYIIAGTTLSKGKGGNDIWILKLNKKGRKIWGKTFGGEADDEAFSIQQTTDKGYIIAGHTYSKGNGQSDIWIIKINTRGQLVWEKTFGGKYHDGVYSIQQTKRKGYIIAGYSYTLTGRSDFRIIRLSISGKILWNKTYSRSLVDTAFSINQTSDGGFITAGTSFSKGVGSWDIWILKLNKNGDIVWNKTYGGSQKESICHIQQIKKNKFIIAGSTSSKGTGLQDFLMVKFKEKKGLNKILIKTSPSKANIYLNKKLKGLSPLKVSAQTQGIYNLKIQKVDYYGINDKIKINNKSPDKLFYDLKLKTGTLMIVSHYSNVHLSIDNQKETIINEDKIFQIKLKQGKHKLKFKTIFFKERKKIIYIVNKTTNIIILNETFFK